jgi:hypothetical protein
MLWWVYVQRYHLRLAGQRASIVVTFYCIQVVIAALTVDCGGLLACCNVCWFFPGWRHVHRECWSLCGVVWFVTYRGAFAVALRIFDWDLMIHFPHLYSCYIFVQPIFMEVIHLCVLQHKQHLFSRTQNKPLWFKFCIYICAKYFDPYLGYHQECQNKTLIKEDIKKSKGPLVYSYYF